MTEKQIIKSIKTLAKDECANYQRGYCLETDQRCHLINPRYESIYDGTIDCDYFLEYVLPADWELRDLVAYAMWYDEADEDNLLPGMKRCAVCEEPFTPTNTKQKYCRRCADKINRDQTRQRMYQQRKNV